ncbi:MAG: MBL fold metallo-hydrolase [Thermodesulfobacteriota bacterium]
MNLEAFVKERIRWLGHATFRIEGSSATVYIDPWKLTRPVPADVVCITHSHYDHLSEDDVKKIRKPSTVIIGPADCKAGFGAAFKEISPGKSISVGPVTVEAVPAYNTDKSFHAKSSNWVGYILTIDGVRIYHCGDTDEIPEMAHVNTDVALIPVGGTYTMTVDQAATACEKINPKIAIPMHCGDIVGSLSDRVAFKAACKIPVVTLDVTA